ncbi:hypothetical protein FRB90_001776 [Tulasnella sp. 427]|nr:hypothetical protein FRB90_001776 [Tulasnella sp. 427]
MYKAATCTAILANPPYTTPTSPPLHINLSINMGLIVDGEVLPWDQGRNFADHIKDHGIIQLLNIWTTSKDRQNFPFKWGEEIECMIIAFDDKEKNAKLALCQEELLPKLKGYVSASGGQSRTMPSFQSEYGRYMIESTPGVPYEEDLSDLLTVETNMRQRRTLIRKLASKPNHVPLTLTVYPRVGVSDVFTEPHRVLSTDDKSMFLPEKAVTSIDPKYKAIADGIDSRRGHKPMIHLPVFRDSNTPRPFKDPTVPSDDTDLLPEHILLDAVSFGPGCCCLQVTMQAADIDQARILYDSLIPIAPLMLALTAASPAYKGFLSDVDCRWDMLSQCIDDRTQEEKRQRIPARWSHVRWYLTEEGVKYNDIEMVYCESTYGRLKEAGMDDILAKHFANLYIRDPLVVYPQRLDQDDEKSNEHFESIQSSVWQTLRFKPPTPSSKDMGWRVEFRSMEVQLTDFENAAFAVFVVLLSRALLKFSGVKWGLPISKVGENMRRAQERDAARLQKFWFNSGKEDEEMTLDEIINGKGNEFEGLMVIVRRYLDSLGDELVAKERSEIELYLDLVSRKARGALKTAATWIRDFVRSHPEYKHDSVITREINYDMLKAIDAMEKGEAENSAGLLPSHYSSRRTSNSK